MNVGMMYTTETLENMQQQQQRLFRRVPAPEVQMAILGDFFPSRECMTAGNESQGQFMLMMKDKNPQHILYD